MVDVAIIGCGIIGAAAAYTLSRYRLDTVILETENDVASGTTKANSAILHAGYDPRPGSLMAKLNVRGTFLAKEICKRLDVPVIRCGSLVVAFHESELPVLRELLERGRQNGVENLRILGRPQLRAIEPNLSGEAVSALFAPSAAVVCPWELTLAMAETAVSNGCSLHLGAGVTGIKKIPGGYRLETGEGSFDARFVLNAAGVASGDVHRMIAPPSFTIYPDRGEYFLLDQSEGGRVRHVVFQCPTPAGKGVLVSPTVHGNLIVGPNNEPSAPDDVSTTAAGLAEVRSTAQKSVPSLNFRENIRNFSGIRANSDIDDFIIAEAEGAPGFVDLAGIKSPGLSAAPAIGEMAAELLGRLGLRMERKTDFRETRRRVRFCGMSPEEKAALISEKREYGQIVCRCESVTEGEILDAFRSPIPPRSVDAVKRRCNAGMGRCQGGFCGSRVAEILSRELKIPLSEVLQDNAGSYILTGETKGECADV